MDNLIYILFICVVAPLLLMLPLIKHRSKLVLGYMIIGIVLSLCVSEINGMLLGLFGGNVEFVSTGITPISEEIIKALPILFYGFVFSDKKEKLIPISLATGIGFGLFENTVVLVQSLVSGTQGITIGWAVIRGFSTALMHGVCTMAVGYGISFIHKRKKLFYCGTFALLSLAITFHGIYNMLVLSEYKVFGFLLPALAYIPILIEQYRFLKNKL